MSGIGKRTSGAESQSDAGANYPDRAATAAIYNRPLPARVLGIVKRNQPAPGHSIGIVAVTLQRSDTRKQPLGHAIHNAPRVRCLSTAVRA